jgi:hypothetical protein
MVPSSLGLAGVMADLAEPLFVLEFVFVLLEDLQPNNAAANNTMTTIASRLLIDNGFNSPRMNFDDNKINILAFRVLPQTRSHP